MRHRREDRRNVLSHFRFRFLTLPDRGGDIESKSGESRTVWAPSKTDETRCVSSTCFYMQNYAAIAADYVTVHPRWSATTGPSPPHGRRAASDSPSIFPHAGPTQGRPGAGRTATVATPHCGLYTEPQAIRRSIHGQLLCRLCPGRHRAYIRFQTWFVTPGRFSMRRSATRLNTVRIFHLYPINGQYGSYTSLLWS